MKPSTLALHFSSKTAMGRTAWARFLGSSVALDGKPFRKVGQMVETSQQVVSPACDLHLATSSRRIPELDGLRGFAILLVLVYHYIATPEHRPLGFPLHRLFQALSVCWSGVDLFFVLSGFLIGGILLESRESPRYFQAFYLRRIHRILPIYYSWLFLYVVVRFVSARLAPGWSLLNSSDYTGVPAYIVFIQNFFYFRSRLDWIWLGVTWSLAIEELRGNPKRYRRRQVCRSLTRSLRSQADDDLVGSRR